MTQGRGAPIAQPRGVPEAPVLTQNPAPLNCLNSPLSTGAPLSWSHVYPEQRQISGGSPALTPEMNSEKCQILQGPGLKAQSDEQGGVAANSFLASPRGREGRNPDGHGRRPGAESRRRPPAVHRPATLQGRDSGDRQSRPFRASESRNSGRPSPVGILPRGRFLSLDAGTGPTSPTGPAASSSRSLCSL